MMIYFGIASLGHAPPPLLLVLQMIGVGSAVLLVVGLLTPIAGSLGAVAKVWIGILRISSQSGDPWIAIAQAVLPAAVAMIGPGAWSVDSRLFGRKRIDLSDL
jgi:putative oxidoreductase